MIKQSFELLKTTFTEWNEDHAPRMAAALAYYTAFSLAPLLVVVIAIVGFIYSDGTARSEIIRQVQSTMGADAADMVNSLIEQGFSPGEGIISTIIGLVTLVLGAMGVFGQLQGALNTIWEADEKPREGGILGLVRDKLLSFGMILVIGFLLLVSLVISTVLASVHTFLSGLLPSTQTIFQIVSFLISFGITTLLFGLIYKVLPDIEVSWRDVWVGAAFTSLLFSIGRYLLGWYLGNSSTASAYGAAGSFVIILLWIYYSAQILLFGAEFTQVYSRQHGSHAGVPAAAPPAPAVPLQPPARPALPQPKASTASSLIFTIGTLIVALIAGRIQRRSE
ncbi:MAG: YihY/virulence factor BrkB family protein [Anaerolineae bacterium]|nr:YihY/virulence factor BrkB family protein [Anaerolineae bacterium]